MPKKTASLRSKLTVYFLSIVAVLLAMNGGFIAIHIVSVSKYEAIGTNIFSQYELISDVADLTAAYNSYRNDPSPTNLTAYNLDKAKVSDLLVKIRATIPSADSDPTFLGVYNTVNNVISDTDAGVASLKSGSIADTSFRYTEASRKLTYVRENTAELILQGVERSAALEKVVAATDRLTFGFGTGLLFLIVIAALFASNAWSKHLILPLIRLANLSKKISGGDLGADVDRDLIEDDSEVGSLAGSFDTMVRNLRDNLHELDKDKQAAEDLVAQRTKELREEKARLLASINSLSLGFIIADKDDAILLKNPAISSILEIKEELKSLKDVSKYFDKFDVVGSCRECIVKNKVVELKDVAYGKKYLRIFCAPVSNGAEPIGYVFLAEDITEAKVMERSRDEFFAVASHELRTPLTAIRGNTEMILDLYSTKIVDNDMREMLSDINLSSVRLIDMVNDFLEVSRLEQHRFEMKPTAFDMSEVIAKVVRDLQSSAAQKGIGLAFSPPPKPLPQTFADKNRTEQILVNLVGNAIKFTKKGGVTITAETIDHLVKVRVQDTGLGISELNQTLLFRKFQQAGEQMLARDVTQSTGLGLYICKLIVSNMGGTIGLEKSELDRGSVFSFTLPAVS